MGNETVLATLEYFSGINSVDHPTLLPYEIKDTPSGKKAVYSLQIAENLWIDNTMHLRSRTDGQTLRLAGDIYNAWSNGTTFLYMIADTLYELSKSYSGTALLSGIAVGLRMSYAAFNDRIYFSNGVNIGYIKSGVAHSVAVPSVKFKLSLPAGKFLAVYRARLYSASGKILFIADPLSDCYDTRSGYRQFSSNITMVRPVENGVYVADEEKTYFMKGLSPEEFTREMVEDNAVIPYTDVNIDAQDIGDGNKNGTWAVWTSVEGICLGTGDGTVQNLTKDRLALGDYLSGAAMIWDKDQSFQYINTLRG
jgi:hypothetical protein